ncbi:MAG: hypothetical protein GY863_10420, partial [bacterium]|nr:hypothetical protein [bacterium]
MKSSVGNKLYIFSITLLMLILCNPLIINAQGLSSSKDSERSQWNISVYLGSTNSGPAEDIEQAMINSEFNDVSTRLGMRKVYPHSETGIGGFGSYPWLVSIQRSFSDKMSAG